MSDEVTTIETLIVKSRIKAIAKAKGKILSSSFLAFLDQEIRETVNVACHMVGSRKIVKAGEFREYRALLARCSGGRR